MKLNNEDKIINFYDLNDKNSKVTDKDSAQKLNPSTSLNFYEDGKEEINENSSVDNLNHHLENLKMFYENKMKDIDCIYQVINTKDLKITELTNFISCQLEQNEIPINFLANGNNNQLTQECGETELDNLKICINDEGYSNECEVDKRINEKEIEIELLKKVCTQFMFQEINELKRKHNKRKQDLIKEFDDNLNNYLEDIHDDYLIKINEFTIDHEKSIKNLKEQIMNIKLSISEYDTNYVKNIDHNEIISNMKRVIQSFTEFIGTRKRIENVRVRN